MSSFSKGLVEGGLQLFPRRVHEGASAQDSVLLHSFLGKGFGENKSWAFLQLSRDQRREGIIVVIDQLHSF
jgi:hypothetical protein